MQQDKDLLQNIFDQVITHLLEQGGVSRTKSGDYCAYRGEYGKSCAVGYIIKDEFYDSSLEGQLVYHDAVKKAVMDSLGLTEIELGYGLISFLRKLQCLHDQYGPYYGNWADYIKRYSGSIAVEYGLKPYSEKIYEPTLDKPKTTEV